MARKETEQEPQFSEMTQLFLGPMLYGFKELIEKKSREEDTQDLSATVLRLI